MKKAYKLIPLLFSLVFFVALEANPHESNNKTILVTGGVGYIGSHIIVELLSQDYNVVVVDNLSNSEFATIEKIERIAGKKISHFYKFDMRNKKKLEKVFADHVIWTVIHMAALKAVPESINKPLLYYDNNIVSTINLLSVMAKHQCYNLIFSSSASVYGEPEYLPIDEEHPIRPINPYGQTKAMIETILKDVAAVNSAYNFVALRYFNPIGAHESGLIGEEPNEIPNNLLPYAMKVVQGELSYLEVFGNDYDTIDGTGVRDYIHVVDLAQGHIAAVKSIEKKEIGFRAYNLGTGQGYSVLQIVEAMEKQLGRTIPYKIIGRRPGDSAQVFANPSLAEQDLGWKAQFSLKKMIRDSLKRLRVVQYNRHSPTGKVSIFAPY